MTSPETDPSLLALSEAVGSLVRAVAENEVMPRYRCVGHRRKADGSLLTEADEAAQAALVSGLTALAPFPVMGEEMSSEEQSLAWDAGADGVWCVDPIDGTSNFVHGVPYFAVSVALLRDRRPVLGVVYAPVTGEMFRAVRGRGAWLGDVSLECSDDPRELGATLANIDFKRLPKALGTALVAAPPYASQRNLGAATLEWCYLAAGRLDIYLHGGQQLWDYAAGSLILAEAGGAVGTLENDDFWAEGGWKRSVVAARDPLLYRAWRSWVQEHRGT